MDPNSAIRLPIDFKWENSYNNAHIGDGWVYGHLMGQIDLTVGVVDDFKILQDFVSYHDAPVQFQSGDES